MSRRRLSESKCLRHVVSVAVAVAATSASAASQEPARARSEMSIPVKKNTPTPPAPAPRVVPGSKTEVVAPPVVVHLIRNEAGTPVMLAERAPTVGGGPAVPWIPLFGLLGGAVLLHSLDHETGAADTPPTTPTGTTPETPATPPATPPVTPPVTPPATPPVAPTTVPEPATVVLFATGLLAIAAVRRRVR